MKRINVLIPDGNDHRALKVVQSLGISFKTNVFIITPKESIVRHSRFCMPFYIPRNTSDDDINLCMRYVLQRYAIDVILPVGEKGISYIHRNDWLRKWNIAPIPDAQALSSVSNKWSLNILLRDLGLDSPDSIIIANKCDVDKISEITKYPVLIKPTHGAGGFGIVFIKNKTSLHSHIVNKLQYGGNREYIVQEYVDGAGTDISLLCNGGEILAFTTQKPIDKTDRAFTYAKMIEFIYDSSILEYCKKLISHIKWTGVAHLDFIKEKSGEKVFLIDFNPRFWGTLLGSTSAGVNFPYLACLSAMGIPYDLPNYKNSKYYDLRRKQLFSFILNRKGNSGGFLQNSNIYTNLLDPLPTIMNKLPISIRKRSPI